MLNENAKKWVAALRDPSTKQIKGVLETSGGQCVLGVPCRLYADEHPEWPVSVIGKTRFGLLETGSYLPSEVVEWLGLQSSVGSYKDAKGKLFSLVILNDDGMSLPDLADLVESEPEGLFV